MAPSAKQHHHHLLLLLITCLLFLITVTESEPQMQVLDKKIVRVEGYRATDDYVEDQLLNTLATADTATTNTLYNAKLLRSTPAGVLDPSLIQVGNKNRKKRIRKNLLFDKHEFIVQHNRIRQEIGESPLRWDKTLARVARRTANNRSLDCEMIHSGQPYGENIYWGGKYRQHTAARAVQAWASETQDYDPKSNSCAPNKQCGHYMQIVWRTSTRFGCARAKCLNGGVYIICNYDPPGNWEGESPFDQPTDQNTPPPPPTPTVRPPPPPQSILPDILSPLPNINLPPILPTINT